MRVLQSDIQMLSSDEGFLRQRVSNKTIASKIWTRRSVAQTRDFIKNTRINLWQIGAASTPLILSLHIWD